MRKGEDMQAEVLDWHLDGRRERRRRRDDLLLVDRRVVHRRPGDPGLGIRAGDARSPAEEGVRVLEENLSGEHSITVA